ncbi:N-acetylmuramoyl-L-alanine amidase [Clostridium sp. CM027]|uniref:N-acetylmuramoyl-L-alanine amidase family protein n=1 Tax=Clostridium sp. CM027 TaxID=2849865 RepID=UPI001C6E4600|nr:N-acetylmuramoyl-L-alanine amidase [Clostridium sp. CM027]MBW9144833.1 N-acetylmuramoyl-L-alanine amidase [Clostridium sp. CM027]UVE40424.1 N-acetylmuramoyl-L-alanine amidase [Clostridium sp. CM027]
MKKSTRLAIVINMLVIFILPLFNVQALALAQEHPSTATENKICLDFPSSPKVYGDKGLKVAGWALSPKGVKEVKIYLDDKAIGTATYGLERPDVDSAFQGYPDGSKSGFNYDIENTNLDYGVHKILVEAIGLDGSKFKEIRNIEKVHQLPKMIVDKPLDQKVVNSDEEIISGWAINQNGMKEVQIYLNNQFLSKANYNLDRSDVADAYPNYPDGNKVGFSYKLDTSLIKTSTATVTIKAVGNNGDIQESNIILKKESMSYIDDPTLSRYVNGRDLKIAGWALNPSGVNQVKIYVNDVECGNADYGLIREDVKDAYPYYNNASKSGFDYTINANKLAVGRNVLKVVTVGNDKSSIESQMVVEVYKGDNTLFIDTPLNNQKFEKEILIDGWALNTSKIKEVNMYLDNKFIGSAVYGIDRSDVNKAFPGYPSGDFSGFTYKIPLNNTPPGNYDLRVEAVGADGTKKTIDNKIIVEKKKPIGYIDSPSYSNIAKINTIDVKGWALNAEGVRDVKVYVDGQLKGMAQCGLTRDDVNGAFPGYINGGKSGFQYALNTNEILLGQHLLRIEIIGNDSSSQVISKQLNIVGSEPRVFLNEIGSLTKDKQLVIGGWALNKSSMKEVDVYIDGVYKGKADYGLNRPDVNSAYNGYPNGEKSGFNFVSSLSDLSIGKHSVKVTSVGNDLSEASVERSFDLQKLNPNVNIDTDFSDYDNLTERKELNIRGWALNDSKVKQVDIYLDGQLKGSVQADVLRSDVQAAYPKYPYSINSGFAYKLGIDDIGFGTHTIGVYAKGYDNTIAYKSIHFKIQATIVIDPGHNFGGDDGSYSTFGGVTYVERNLNMQLALKLKNKLVQYGFNVIMTRNENDKFYDNETSSLKKRVDIANNAKADLFLSIHHDFAYTPESSGITTHYSTYRPNLDKSGIVTKNGINYDTTPTLAALKSADLAQRLIDALANLGYNNRGKSDHNLYVTQNTNMPSILVECGFISNLQEAAKTANNAEQDAFASKMAEVVYNYFK